MTGKFASEVGGFLGTGAFDGGLEGGEDAG